MPSDSQAAQAMMRMPGGMPLAGGWALNRGARAYANKKARVHLIRNHIMCERCCKVWEDESDPELRKFHKAQPGDPPSIHRGCGGGHILRYYDLPEASLTRFVAEKVATSDPAFHEFYPVMGDLVRADQDDRSHHSVVCQPDSCSCCSFNRNGSIGPSPGNNAQVQTHICMRAMAGWEEQSAKTCAAASVAGVINAVFHPATAAKRPRSQQNDDEQAFQQQQQRQQAEVVAKPKVRERDVLESYCQWARDANKISALAALRGSCGLIPSTRKIGNYRLLMQTHAVARAHFGIAASSQGSSGSGSDGGDDDDDDDGGIGSNISGVESPLLAERLLGHWTLRENVSDGGRVGGEPVGEGGAWTWEREQEDSQWEMIKEAIQGGASLLIHSRNHYSLIFGSREWICPASGAPRRQVLTATRQQRPHVWYCFRQLLADIAYSRVNQVIVIRRAPGAGEELAIFEAPKARATPRILQHGAGRGGVLPRVGDFKTPRSLARAPSFGVRRSSTKACGEEGRKRMADEGEGGRGGWVHRRLVSV